MNNNILLSIAINIIPLVAIIFVVLLVIYKIYIKIRSRFHVNANCWFCNQNTKVPYLEANSWTCPSCEQYNGFDKYGDYNREIYEQLDCSRNSERFNVCQSLATGPRQPPHNGFCEQCNEAQRLKVEKLSQFEPKNESRWNAELKVYKAELEDHYRLCSTCDRHLNKVLREKKKMVLGSKFLDFIIKGAETLKQPHLNQIQHADQQKKKRNLRSLIIIMSLIYLCCLINSMPPLSKDYFVKFLGESLGRRLFLLTSHIFALSKVIASNLDTIRKHTVITKISLFSRTLFMMTMYSMGLKATHYNYCSLYISLYPFAILALSFFHNVLDGFHLTRFTGLMTIWSMFAGGLINQTWIGLSLQTLMFVTSFLTLVMTYSSKAESSPKLYDANSNSFHKIYSDDYLSDDEAMTMSSQELNGSCVSMQSVRSNKSSPLIQTRACPVLTRGPLTSSTFSLHQLPSSQLSLNSSFGGEINQTARPILNTPSATPAVTRQGFFASNLELNRRERPVSNIFDMNASTTNYSCFNNSFTEGNKSHYLFNARDNNVPFYNTGNNSLFVKHNPTFLAPKAHSGLHSPFSVSSCPVYPNQTPRSNTHHKLLSPTRLSTNNLNSNTSWLSGGYFNQRSPMPSEIPRTGLIIPTVQTQLFVTPMEQCVSRSSSHSSGFESQNGRLNGNVSRENSMCPDFHLDYNHRTFTTDNTNTFQPIDSPTMRPFPSRHLENSAIWRQATFSYRPNNNTNSSRNTIDSFNFRKINEELPSIKRVELLPQWKEGHNIVL